MVGYKGRRRGLRMATNPMVTNNNTAPEEIAIRQESCSISGCSCEWSCLTHASTPLRTTALMLLLIDGTLVFFRESETGGTTSSRTRPSLPPPAKLGLLRRPFVTAAATHRMLRPPCPQQVPTSLPVALHDGSVHSSTDPIPPPPLLATAPVRHSRVLSLDGRWPAYCSDATLAHSRHVVVVWWGHDQRGVLALCRFTLIVVVYTVLPPSVEDPVTRDWALRFLEPWSRLDPGIS